ncbi:MAG: nucleoside recognition protein, partial [Hungatella sp.]
MKKSISGMAAVAVLILLLCNPVLSYEGAKRGLLLWSQTILPSLLPFMICSNMIVAWDAMHLLTFPLRPLLHQVMRLSDGGSYILIAGLLCGYPMGAKTCSEFLEDRQITSAEGAYLLSICNHPSPMFLLGYVASGLDQHLSIVWILIALYLPILPISLLSRRIYGISKPCKSSKASTKEKSSFDFTMMNSIEVMVKIGGYIMLFSILANFLQVLPMHVHATKAILLGFV